MGATLNLPLFSRKRRGASARRLHALRQEHRALLNAGRGGVWASLKGKGVRWLGVGTVASLIADAGAHAVASGEFGSFAPNGPVAHLVFALLGSLAIALFGGWLMAAYAAREMALDDARANRQVFTGPLRGTAFSTREREIKDKIRVAQEVVALEKAVREAKPAIAAAGAAAPQKSRRANRL